MSYRVVEVYGAVVGADGEIRGMTDDEKEATRSWYGSTSSTPDKPDAAKEGEESD